MSVPSELPGQHGGAPRAARPAVARRRRAERPDLPPLPAEREWWAAAPLRDGRRALREMPPGAVAELTGHYLPFVQRSLGAHHAFLSTLLGGGQDVAGQAAAWLLEAMCCYDPRRGAPFAGYLAAKVPHWVADAARGGSRAQRFAAESETAYARAVERSLREKHRPPTLVELAVEFGEDVAATGERLRVVALRRAVRYAADVEAVDVAALPVRADGAVLTHLPAPADDGSAAVDARLLALEARAAVTAALVDAAFAPEDGGDVNAAGLWTLLLEQLAGITRADLQRTARRDRLAIAAAQARLLADVRWRLVA